MKTETLLNLLGLLGLVLTPSGFISFLNPYIRYPALVLGVIAVGFYFKVYYDDRMIKMIELNKRNIENQSKRIIAIENQIANLQGWKEAAEHFSQLKRKGQINPIVLIIIIIIIILIIIYTQKGG